MFLIKNRSADEIVSIGPQPRPDSREETFPFGVEDNALEAVTVHDQIVLLPIQRQLTDVAYLKMYVQPTSSGDLLRHVYGSGDQIYRIDSEAMLSQKTRPRASSTAIFESRRLGNGEAQARQDGIEETPRTKVIESLLAVDLRPRAFSFTLDSRVSLYVFWVVVPQVLSAPLAPNYSCAIWQIVPPYEGWKEPSRKEACQMRRQPELERMHRLSAKTLDQVFVALAQEGPRCSLSEAQALTELARDIYFPWHTQPEAIQAGQLATARSRPTRPLRLLPQLRNHVSLQTHQQ